MLHANDEITIRETEEDDLPDLKILYREAFADEDLFPLVVELFSERQGCLSLCALKEGVLLGHITFTRCHASPEGIPLALLGPMAVLPEHQRHGTGSSLIKTGLNLMRKEGVIKVLVLGDPNYYGRFDFAEESGIQPAYAIPEEWKAAWQSAVLTASATPPSGKLIVTKPWQRPELWSE